MTNELRLSVEITEQKSISTLYFSGTYDPVSITLMKEMIGSLVRNNRLKLILKFDTLEGLNKEAYDYLEAVHADVARLGGAIVLICPPEVPQKICEELKHRYKFLIFQDFDQARNYFIKREF